jgi:hypothetical protein
LHDFEEQSVLLGGVALLDHLCLALVSQHDFIHHVTMPLMRCQPGLVSGLFLFPRPFISLGEDQLHRLMAPDDIDLLLALQTSDGTQRPTVPANQTWREGFYFTHKRRRLFVFFSPRFDLL